ncbi:hypothetical protein QYE76_071543 [Lolium multiflorum]|uniref:Retrovirus-related Pol polyprotein from transposon TNT 1-94-like beta-barrel domain-containing protein n=1 Tax=Lolium multiflorum TaxID=4521 RepID=A0AAD8SLJ4_LOLMU|nr:hypothetical protein QYE76_071543 [Lolium multiflorum]
MLSSHSSLNGDVSNPFADADGSGNPAAARPVSAATIQPINIRHHVSETLNFEESNFSTWQTFFNITFRKLGITDHINGLVDAQMMLHDVEWTQIDQCIVSWLYTTVSRPILNIIIQPSDTAEHVWTAINNLSGMFHAWPPGWRAPGQGILGPRPTAPHPQAHVSSMTPYYSPVPAAPQTSAWDQAPLLAALNNLSMQGHGNSNGADWFFDTGATSHMANNPGIVSHLTPFNNSSRVIVGNGSSLPITHTGDTSFSTSSFPIHLRNVAITPGLIKNLISVRSLTRDNPITIEFDAFGFSIKDFHTRVVILRCDSDGELYPLVAGRPPLRQNPSKEIFSELDETFAQGPIFARSFQKTEEITKWGHEAAGELGRRGPSPGAPTCPWALVWPPRCPSAYLKSPSRNPAESHDTENLRDAAANPISGIQEIASAPWERGFISRRTLHRHGRLRSDE